MKGLHRCRWDVREPLAGRDLADPTLVEVKIRCDPVLVVASDDPGLDDRHLLWCQFSYSCHKAVSWALVKKIALESRTGYLLSASTRALRSPEPHRSGSA